MRDTMSPDKSAAPHRARLPNLAPVPCSSAYFQLFVDRQLGLLVLRRTKEVYPSLLAMPESLAVVRAATRSLGARFVLIDMSHGPTPRNDVNFENAGRETRQELSRGFDKVAFLMGTAVGALQANRLAREEGRAVHVYRDEAEAIAWLLGDGE